MHRVRQSEVVLHQQQTSPNQIVKGSALPTLSGTLFRMLAALKKPRGAVGPQLFKTASKNKLFREIPG